jgi:hypothetical protein
MENSEGCLLSRSAGTIRSNVWDGALMRSRWPGTLRVPNDSVSLFCRGSSHPLDALPVYAVRPSPQSPVQDLSTPYSGKKGRRHAKRQP